MRERSRRHSKRGSGQQAIEQRGRAARRRRAPTEAVRAEELNCTYAAPTATAKTMRPARASGVRGSEIMKKLKSRRAALELVKRDRQRLAEPERRGQQHPEPGATNASVTSPRARRRPTARRDQQDRESEACPTARATPSAIAREHQRDEREVGGVEEVLAARAQRRICSRSRARRQRLPASGRCAAAGTARGRDQRALAPGDQAGGRQGEASTPGGRPFERGLRRQGAPQRDQHLRRGRYRSPGEPFHSRAASPAWRFGRGVRHGPTSSSFPCP